MIGKLYYFVIILIALVSITISILIRPQSQEIALMKFQDKKFEYALSEYQSLWDSGDRSISVIVPLSKLYLQMGDITYATKIVEEFVSLNPKSTDARRLLGTLYQYDQRPYDYLNNLEIIETIKSSRKSIIELSHLYNSYEMYDKQIRILTKLIKKHHPTEKDYTDLAYLYAMQKQYEKAEEILDELFQRVKNPEDKSVLFMVSVILDMENPKKAYKLSKKHLGAKKIELTLRVAELMLNKKAIKYAYEILYPLEYQAEHNEFLLQSLVGIEIDLNLEERSYERLLKLMEKNKLPNSLVPYFFTIAIKKYDFAILDILVEKDEIDDLSAEQMFSLIEISLFNKKTKLLKKIRANLSEDYFKRHPVVETTLALLLDKNKEKDNRSIAKLFATQKGHILNNNYLIRLAYLCNKIDRADLTKEILKNFQPYYLDETEAYDLYELIITLKQERRGLEIFRTLESQNSEEIAYLNHITLLLEVTNGNYRKTKLWLETKPQDIFLLKNLFFITQEYNHPRISFEIISYLITIDKSPQTQGLMGEMLMQNNKPLEALPYLRNAISKHNNFVYDYISALAYASSKKNKSAHKELQKFINHKSFYKKYTLEQKQSTLYVLIDYQLKQDAKNLLTNLLDYHKDVTTLKLFTNTAMQAGMYDMAEKSYKELHKKSPKDPEILLNLSLTTYYKEQYADSLTSLKKYFEIASGDYQANYLYAELLWNDQRQGQAKKYYKIAEQKLQKLPLLTHYQKRMKAQIFFRFGKIEEGLKIFKQLFKQNPGDINLKTDYANHLIEYGHLDEAEKILNK